MPNRLQSCVAQVCLLATAFGFIATGRLIAAEDNKKAAADSASPVSFTQDILPVLQQNCVACHNETKTEADVNVESFDVIMNSEYGELIVPGDPDESRLYVLAAHLDDPIMPPESNAVAAKAFTPAQLDAFQRWIKQGAKPDPSTTTPDAVAWKSLPTGTAPSYATAITPDGRLAAASVGNRVFVFGRQSTSPLGELTDAGADGATSPAHRDYVQDLIFSDSGKTLVSSGYRHAKIWSLDQPASVALPSVDANRMAAITLDPTGTLLAVLDLDHVLRVAKVGEQKWLWDKTLELADDESAPIVALKSDGQTAVVAKGTILHVVNSESVESVTAPTDVTAAVVLASDRFVTGNSKGEVAVWERSAELWQSRRDALAAAAVKNLVSRGQSSGLIIAADAGNQVGTFDVASGKFSKRSKQVSAATIATSDDAVWLALSRGELFSYDAGEGKSQELTKHDPRATEDWKTSQWSTVTVARLVAADQADLKTSEANAKSEKDNQSKLTAEIDKKKSDLEAAQKASKEADEAADVATMTLSEKRAVDPPDEAAITKAQQAVDEASKEKQLKAEALADAQKALVIAEQAKKRSDAKLNELEGEIARWKAQVEQAQEEQAQRKERETQLQEAYRNSMAADRALVATSSGGGFITASSSTGLWSLWSSAGDWIATITGLPPADSLVASSRGTLIFQSEQGGLTAFRVGDPRWTLKQTIGSPNGDSPFADRVLCLDIDPQGTMLATGGGDPSRQGDIHLWSVVDGSQQTAIEAAHRDTVLAIQFSPDGQRLASASADRLIKIWDVTSGEMRGVLEGHTHHVTALDWNVSQRQLSSSAADADMRAWDLNTMKTSRKMALFKSEVTDLAYVGEQNRIAVVGGDQTFRLVNTDNGRQEKSVGLANGYAYSVSASRDGQVFIVGGGDGRPKLLDKTGATVLQFDPK